MGPRVRTTTKANKRFADLSEAPEYAAWRAAEKERDQAILASDDAEMAFAQVVERWLEGFDPVERLDVCEALGDGMRGMVGTTLACIYTWTLETMAYDEYLRTGHWARTRQEVLERAGNACQTCSSTRRLQVHHRTYDRRGNELPEDLTVLCDDCHATFHEHRRLVRD